MLPLETAGRCGIASPGRSSRRAGCASSGSARATAGKPGPWSSTAPTCRSASRPAQARLARARRSSGLEIGLPVEIGKEPRLLGAPSELGSGARARGWAVDPEEVRDPPKMACRLLGGLGDDRQAQPPADDFGDLADRYALVGDAVELGSR